MATVSGNLTAAGVSSTLRLDGLREAVSYSATGTFVARWQIERALSTDESAWEIVAGPFSTTASGNITSRPHDRYRFRVVSYTSGTVAYSVSEPDTVFFKRQTPDGAVVYEATQAAHYFYGDVIISGTITGLGGSFLPLSGGTVTGATSVNNNLTVRTSTGNTVFATSGTTTPTFSTKVNASSLTTLGRTTVEQGTITLSGSTAPNLGLNVIGNIAGTASGVAVGNDTRGTHSKITVSSDTAVYPSAWLNYFFVESNFSAGADGGRRGIGWQMNTNGATTLSGTGSGLVGIGGQCYANHNAGGSASGFGTSQFGYGVLFGSNPRVRFGSGATYWAGGVGEEIGLQAAAGSNLGYMSVLQLVLEDNHAVHGLLRDCMLLFGAQSAAVAGARQGLLVGSGTGKFPIDPDAGYIVMARHGNAADAIAAGGIDFNAVDFTGASGEVGGGFAFRSDGVRVLPKAAQIGYGKIDGSSGGLKITAPYSILSGTPTVSAGGSGYTVGEILGDIYGNIVEVASLSGSAVATVTVIRRGWTDSAPGGAVTFNSLNSVSGTKGSGCTLTTAWSAVDDITIGSATDEIGFFAATPVSKPTGVPVTSAGIHAALVSLGLIAA